MKRVELSFTVETTDCYITVWVATDNKLYSGDVLQKFKDTAAEIRADLVRITHHSKEYLTSFLENHPGVVGFKISSRADYKNLSVVVNRHHDDAE